MTFDLLTSYSNILILGEEAIRGAHEVTHGGEDIIRSTWPLTFWT